MALPKVLVGIAALGLTAVASTAATSERVDFERRVAAQWAIEEVYWRHRLWPAENEGPKPDLRRMVSEEVVREKVVDALLRSEALETLWGRRIENVDLQDELARMVESSRAPRVLDELFAALENDPDLAAECLARPALTDRWIRRLYDRDPRLHAASRAAAERAVRDFAPSSDLRSLGGQYAEQVWILDEDARGPSARAVDGTTARVVDPAVWAGALTRLARGGVPGAIQQDETRFFVQAIVEMDGHRLRMATVSWPKRPFDEWWSETRAALGAGAPVANAPDRLAAIDVARLSADEAASRVSAPDAPGFGCTPDTWTATSTTSAPSARVLHSAVWTGAEMVVWGGWNGSVDFNTGGRYDPATDTWTPTSTTGAPTARDSHTAVWTGSRVVVWGGIDEDFINQNTGGRYDPTANSWAPTSTTGAPTGRTLHTAVWTGSRMVVWGGVSAAGDQRTGGRYNPGDDTWSETSLTGAPTARDSHTAVWTGSVMVVWGGVDSAFAPLGTGGRYDPSGNTWQATSTTGAPSPRAYHTAVWTGAKMIVWGGWDGSADRNNGGRYDPGTDQWIPTSTTGAPSARELHTAVWSGTEMIVWGGRDDAYIRLASGGRYDASGDSWTPTPSTGAPSARESHTAVWTSSEMVIWGGNDVVEYFNTGAEYCAGSCASTPPTGAPAITVNKEAGGSRISWTTLTGATGYDLVRGGLGTLRSTGGDFTSATQVCQANDSAATSFLDAEAPMAGSGFWYLVRGMNCGGPGTYDGPGARQSGSRDAEIDAAPSGCP